jgi:hypothetical protein
LGVMKSGKAQIWSRGGSWVRGARPGTPGGKRRAQAPALRRVAGWFGLAPAGIGSRRCDAVPLRLVSAGARPGVGAAAMLAARWSPAAPAKTPSSRKRPLDRMPKPK